MKTVYLGLGSNVGDREAMLQAAVDELHSRRCLSRRLSSVYETSPWIFPASAGSSIWWPKTHTDLFPRQLLARIGKIEQQLGRRRLVAKGPRSIDIDILLYGNFVIRTPSLVIPHERLLERRFVLVPLLELAPDLRDPGQPPAPARLLGAVAGQAIRKVDFQPVIPG